VEIKKKKPSYGEGTRKMKKKRKIIIMSFVAAIIIFCIIGRILLKEKTLTERAALISGLSVPNNVKVVKYDEFWWISNGYLYIELQFEKEQLSKIVEEAKTKKEYLLGTKAENLSWYFWASMYCQKIYQKYIIGMKSLNLVTRCDML
jgi:ATP-dependent protease Clp ATPase subunit